MFQHANNCCRESRKRFERLYSSCTHLSCMTSHMEIHRCNACVLACVWTIWVAPAVCVNTPEAHMAHCHSALLELWPSCPPLAAGDGEGRKMVESSNLGEKLSQTRLRPWHLRGRSSGTLVKWRTFIQTNLYCLMLCHVLQVSQEVVGFHCDIIVIRWHHWSKFSFNLICAAFQHADNNEIKVFTSDLEEVLKRL